MAAKLKNSTATVLYDLAPREHRLAMLLPLRLAAPLNQADLQLEAGSKPKAERILSHRLFVNEAQSCFIKICAVYFS